MASDSDPTEIIITSSNVPVIRSGLSNILFFLCIIAVIFFNQILKELHVSLLPRLICILIICTAALAIYSRSVARIYFKDGRAVVIVRPVSETELEASQIKSIDVYGIPASMTIFLLVRMRKIKFPKWFFFVAVSTNCGSYGATFTKLKKLSEGWVAEKQL